MGIHAVALTISEIFWGLKGECGYKKFLETFADGNTDDKKFSRVSNTIHNWRNVLAHQWIASSGYKIEYDYDLNMGFIEKNNKLIINPKIYCQLYLDAFSVGGKIWQINHLLSDKELNDAKERFINKFIEQ